MEVAVLGGLLGAGYLVSRFTQKRVPVQQKINEGFYPAQRGPDSQALTQTPKGSSAIGFGPELDMMYQQPGGQTYPSEPGPGPYGTAFGYATQKPPLAPTQGRSGQFSPDPIASENNAPLVEFRNDGIEESPTYVDGSYVTSPLSGQRIAAQDYKHNNMQPFFGGRMKQNTISSQNQATLDM